jgi:N-acetylglucosamine-6-sulfatase
VNPSRIWLFLSLGILLTLSCAPERTERVEEVSGPPNIIFILTDDLRYDDLEHMPYLRQQLIQQGTTFNNAFVTDPLCCPSRATILRGQYAHNHEVLSNFGPEYPGLGGATEFRSLERENSTIATWLHGGGYKTVLIGKYMNDFKRPVPPGWDEWYDAVPDSPHDTDNYAQQVAKFIKGMKGESQPFFMWLGTNAPHDPAIPAPRHADAFPKIMAPRPPSFDEDVSDKPAWIRKYSWAETQEDEADIIDELYRKRLQSMLDVDELLKRTFNSLSHSGKLSNTYVVFTSDHGYHLGEHHRWGHKWTAYEEVIRIPLIVRGPGVPEGVERSHMVLNNDFAQTFAQLGQVPAPSFVEGRSMVPLLRSDPPSSSDWRSAFLVEAAEEPRNGRPAFESVRTSNHLWVEYASGERELYNLKTDPYELQSLHETAPDNLKQDLSSRLDALRDCATEGCHAAEGF